MEKTNEKKDFLQKTWVVCALALVCTFLWGSASPCIKLGYALFKIPSSETWTQVLFAGTRFVFAGVLTILIGSILNRKMLLPTKSSVPNIVKLAMFQTILQYIFFYIGLAHNSGVKASIINGSNTFFVILVSTIIFRQEKLNLKKIIGCVIGFAGVIVVSMNGQKIDMNLSIMGDGSLFLCALSYAFSSCLMKNYSKKDNPVMLSGYQFIFGGIVMIILGLSFFISCLFLLFRKHSVNLLHQRSKFFRVIQTCQLHNTPFLINQDIACDTCLAERILRKYIRSRVQTQRIGHSG